MIKENKVIFDLVTRTLLQGHILTHPRQKLGILEYSRFSKSVKIKNRIRQLGAEILTIFMNHNRDGANRS